MYPHECIVQVYRQLHEYNKENLRLILCVVFFLEASSRNSNE